MAAKVEGEPAYIVVSVEAGIPTAVEAYRDLHSAQEREQFLRKRMHPENDETGIFEIFI